MSEDTKAREGAEAPAWIKAAWPIHHDGSAHEAGEVFAVPAPVAERLVASGAAAPAEAAEDPAAAETAKDPAPAETAKDPAPAETAKEPAAAKSGAKKLLKAD